MTERDDTPQPKPVSGTPAGDMPLAGRMPALPGEQRASIRPEGVQPDDSEERREDGTEDSPAGGGKDDLANKSTVSLKRSEIVPDPDDEPTRPRRRPIVDNGDQTQRLVPPPVAGDEPTVATPLPAEKAEKAVELEAGAADERPGDQAEAAPATAGAGQVAEQAGREAAVSPEPVNTVERAGHAGNGDTAPVLGEGRTTAEPEATGRAVATRLRGKLTSGSALIAVLLALFGFTLVVQLRSNNTDEGLASARQEDLVRILSDLEAQDTRLQAEIATLENSQRQLTSGVAGRQAALAEADKRAEELGLLAGTLPGRGPGLRITMVGVKASGVLNAVQELRGAGGEVMQIEGSGGQPVRIVASTFFVDAQEGGIGVDGVRLSGPYTLFVIGPSATMETALNIPGGVVASVEGDGGSVNVERREVVEVTAKHKTTTLQYARPVS